jgi:hypothetical protein
VTRNLKRRENFKITRWVDGLVVVKVALWIAYSNYQDRLRLVSTIAARVLVILVIVVIMVIMVIMVIVVCGY